MTEVEEHLEPPSVTSSARKLWTFVGIAAGLAMAAYGFLLISTFIEERTGEVEPPAAAIPTVELFEVTETSLPLRVETSGFLQSPATVAVSAETMGIIVEKSAERGQHVEVGDAIATIDDKLYRARLAAGKARKKAWEAQRDYLTAESGRIEKLVETRALGVSELDQIMSQLLRAQASVDEATAMIEEAGLLLDRCQIRAKRRGVWFRELLKEGEYVQAGQAIGHIRVLDPLELKVEVSASTRLVLSKGQEVDIELVDVDTTVVPSPDYITCRILIMPPGLAPQTGRFPVILEVPNPDGTLLPGLFARARFVLPRHEKLKFVPKQSVFKRFGKTSVYVAKPKVDGSKLWTVEPRYLDLYEIEDEPASWHVQSGLEPGEKIVLSGMDQLSSGAVVRSEVSP